MFLVRVERRDECVVPQITEEPVRRESAWNEGKEEEIKKEPGEGESLAGVKKNNRKPADSSGAPANPLEIKQPAASSPQITASLHFSFIIVSITKRLKD